MLIDELKEKYGLMLSPSNVSEVIGCHPSHVRALCQSGELPAVRIGDRWRIPAAKLAAMLEGEN